MWRVETTIARLFTAVWVNEGCGCCVERTCLSKHLRNRQARADVLMGALPLFYLPFLLACACLGMQASGAKASVGDRPHFLYGAHQRPHNGRIDVVPRQSSRWDGMQGTG